MRLSRILVVLLALLLLGGCEGAPAPSLTVQESEPNSISESAPPTSEALPQKEESAAETSASQTEAKPGEAGPLLESSSSISEAPAQSSVPSQEAPSEAAPETTPAAPVNAGTVFEGYEVTVNDDTTPATFAAGLDWPITTYYFFSANGEQLGSISAQAMNGIMDKYQVLTSTGELSPPDGSPWEIWFAEQFNAYRDVGSSGTGTKVEKEPETGSTAPDSTAPFDMAAAALEIIELTNAQREAYGLNALSTDSELMELAQIRAVEVSTKYSHERPDGSRVVDLGYGENVGAKSSAAVQVESWMGSEGHRYNILRKNYTAIGVGCYQTEEGKLYWVQIFAR